MTVNTGPGEHDLRTVTDGTFYVQIALLFFIFQIPIIRAICKLKQYYYPKEPRMLQQL